MGFEMTWKRDEIDCCSGVRGSYIIAGIRGLILKGLNEAKDSLNELFSY